MKVALHSPHLSNADGLSCTACLLPAVRFKDDPHCRPLIFYIKQDPTSSLITARCPQLDLAVTSHSTRHLQGVIVRELNALLNGALKSGDLMTILDGIGMALVGVDLMELPVVDHEWEVPYQTKRQG